MSIFRAGGRRWTVVASLAAGAWLALGGLAWAHPYTLGMGETLWSVAANNGVTVQTIEQANPNVDPLNVWPGMTIDVPDPGASSEGGHYVVGANDTFWSISQRFGVDLATLLKANAGVDPQDLQAGQTIVMPTPNSTGSNGASSQNGSAGASAVAPEAPSSLSQGDMDTLARLVAAEEGNQPYIVRVGVAAVVLNRLRTPGFPKTISAIVFDPGQNESVSNGWYWQTDVTPLDYQAVRDALAGSDPTGGALYFFDPAGATSAWIWTRPQTAVLGTTIFAR